MPQYQIQINLNMGVSYIKFTDANIIMDSKKTFRLTVDALTNFDPTVYTFLIAGGASHFSIGNKAIGLSVPGAVPTKLYFSVELPAAAKTLNGTIIELSQGGDYLIEVIKGGSQSFASGTKNQPFSINLP